ncbi:MAG: hypothetical protein KF889_10310 [Alphaproteobacteria bacterium]|nr:hypothetical protein [Alphaproteobacteria bacterium]MCW5741216.1 hypothetical protein [Alphaproteobacteria bacterium]
MLSEEAIAALAIGVALLFVAGLGIFLWRSERTRREALARLAERRRWVVDPRPASLGPGVRLRLTPRERGTWDCRVHSPSTSGSRSGVRKTEFEDASVRSAGGLVLLGPPVPRENAAFATAMLSSLDGPLGRRLLAMVIGDLADEIGDLRLVDAPGDRQRPYAMFASGDPPALEHDAIESTMRAWIQRFDGAQDFPIIVVGSRSLRVRLRRDVRDLETLESFIDLALELRERITRTVAAAPP